MKLLNSGFRLFIGVLSIFLLTACGGGSGGPGGATGAAGSSGTGTAGPAGPTGPGGGLGGGLLGGNLAGISLTSAGGLNLSAEALNRLGLTVGVLNSADVANLNITGPLPVGVEALRSNGQLIGVQLPGQGSFSLPGAGATSLGTLPGAGTVTLPALPGNALSGVRGTVNNVVGGLRR